MLKSLRIKNFKAVRDSKAIRLTPLTVFIGNNGSGKSNIIEALETYKTIVESNLDTAMRPWRGFEYVRNQATPHISQNSKGDRHPTPPPLIVIEEIENGLDPSSIKLLKNVHHLIAFGTHPNYFYFTLLHD